MDRRYADERAFILRSSVNRIIVRDLLPKRRRANQLTAANCISLPAELSFKHSSFHAEVLLFRG